MNAFTAALLADTLLVLHVGIVVFVVGLVPLLLIGGAKDWLWVRWRNMRIAHLALMLFIAIQSWLGRLCPLTVWEQALRETAGQNAYRESFVEHWLSRLLFWNAPTWVFVAVYTAFALLVTWVWWRVRPGKAPSGRDQT